MVGVTDIVESMHRNISGLAPIIGQPRKGSTKGITGFVYQNVRGVSRAVGTGLDIALTKLAPLLKHRGPSQGREAVLAGLNGVIGDYLFASENPLAISMKLRRNGQPLILNRQALEDCVPRPANKLIVLVHGLCMNDLQWHRDGQDYGAAIARDLGYTPLYLHYNSGLRIATNGRNFAGLLEELLQAWPVPVSELTVVGHSMGGLVARSAVHYAGLANYAWPKQLKNLVFLGTPHHGAPLERAGNWVDTLMGVSPYTAPFARIGQIRSAGVKDLRHGTITDEDQDSLPADLSKDNRKPVPLPAGTKCFAIAGTTQTTPGRANTRLRGDGLVPVKSALGEHQDQQLSLLIPSSRQRICYATHHIDLLGSREVGEQIHRWLTSE